MSDSLAILPRGMGKGEGKGAVPAKTDKQRFIPQEKGGVLLKDPNEAPAPYTFSDSPAYLRQKKNEEAWKRAAELEGKDETRGFLRTVEELGKKQKWDEAFQILERRTAVTGGVFLVTRAVLRWKFCNYHGALQDAEGALKKYGNSEKVGPLAAALSCFLRVCLGSTARDKTSCSRDMLPLMSAWEAAEGSARLGHSSGVFLFYPSPAPRLPGSLEVTEGMQAHDGSYLASPGVRIGYVLLRNTRDDDAPLVVHFHGTREKAADYRGEAIAQKYRGLGVHLLAIDFRGYGWSDGEPSLTTFLSDAEPLAERLPEILLEHGLSWPLAGGVVLSGRSLGAQVAIHVATLFPEMFRALILDSAVATSVTGDRLGRAPERKLAIQCWRTELEKASLDVLQTLDSDLVCLGALEKIRAFNGRLLILHGLADELVPHEGSESLNAAACSKDKELVLVDRADHNNIGQFDAYWAAQRRIALQVQLDGHSESTKHFCAVCHEEAASKCGRCQKVWYCGRKHQAEHWKAHKLKCAGGPPEPKPKVEVVGEACLIAAIATEIQGEEDVQALSICIASIAGHEELVHSVYVGWHAASAHLAERVQEAMHEFEARHATLRIQAIQANNPLTRFEHLQNFAVALQQAPAHAWVAFPDAGGLLSGSYSRLLLPALRKAAVDAKTVAVSSARLARTRPSDTSAVAVRPTSPDHVDQAIGAGTAEVAEAELGMADLFVKVKVLQSFLQATPAGALTNALCEHRFCYKLAHTYGKRIHALSLAEGEWLRWTGLTASLADLDDDDRSRGSDFFEGMQKTGKFDSAEAAARAVATLRQRIGRRLIVLAGGELDPKEFRQLVTESTALFLEEAGLDEVIGVQKWVRETAVEMAEAYASDFNVSVR